MDPVSAVGLVASAAQLAEMAANVYLSLFKYFRAVKQAPKLSKELREEALLVNEVLEELKSALETIDTQPSTTSGLNNAFDGMTKILNKLESEVKESEVMKRLKWPFTEQENKEYLSKLGRYKGTFNLALTTIQR